MLRDPETFGEYQLTLPHGRHRLAARRRRRAARRSSCTDFCQAIRDGLDAALVRASSASRSCRMIEAVDDSLENNGARVEVGAERSLT